MWSSAFKPDHTHTHTDNDIQGGYVWNTAPVTDAVLCIKNANWKHACCVGLQYKDTDICWPCYSPSLPFISTALRLCLSDIFSLFVNLFLCMLSVSPPPLPLSLFLSYLTNWLAHVHWSCLSFRLLMQGHRQLRGRREACRDPAGVLYTCMPPRLRLTSFATYPPRMHQQED